MTVLKVVLANGDCGTAFCTELNGRLVLATADHVLCSLGRAADAQIALYQPGDQKGVEVACELRYHDTADVALILPCDDLPWLKPFRLLPRASHVSTGAQVSLLGYPVGSYDLKQVRGLLYEPKNRRRLRFNANGFCPEREYEATWYQLSLTGERGLSGGPVFDRDRRAFALCSRSGETWDGRRNPGFTIGCAAFHLSEITI